MEHVFVLLPVRNRRESTQRFITCLQAQSHRPWTLVLLDDGSTDGTAAMVRERIPSAVVLTGRGDWWWAGALQAGCGWLTSTETSPDDVVLICNDDTEFDRDFVATGVALLRAHQKALVGAQAFDHQTGRLVDPGQHLEWRHLKFSPASSPAEVNCLSTRGLFLRARALQAIGGFHPRLLPHYLSDYEFTLRARRKGWFLRTDPSLSLTIDPESTGHRRFEGTSLGAFLRQYFSRRSAAHPLAWTAFLALACPWRWKLQHILGIWRNTVYAVLVATGRWLRSAWAARPTQGSGRKK